jgi:Helicase conserved C-terminal domain
MHNYDIHLEETLFANHLIEQVCHKLSGRTDDVCLHNIPHDVYFIGNLRPFSLPSSQIQPAHWRELENKLAPFAFGAEFLLKSTKSVQVAVELNWSCFYRIWPTFTQQISLQREKTEDAEAILDDAVQAEEKIEQMPNTVQQTMFSDDETLLLDQEKEDEKALIESPEIDETVLDRHEARRAKDSLFIRFRKIECGVKITLEFLQNGEGEWETDIAKESLDAAIDNELQRAKLEAISDPECLRIDGSNWEKMQVPSSALESESAFEQFLKTGIAIIPEWKWDVKLNITSYKLDAILFQFAFSNTSPMQNPPDKEVNRPINPNVEPYFFDTSAQFKFLDSKIIPFELEIAPQGFRYDKDFLGRGFNCAVEKTEGGETFKTTHTPKYSQMRYSTQTKPEARFDDLGKNPIPTLHNILRAMEEYLKVWDLERESYLKKHSDWEAIYGGEFDKDKEKFAKEIEDFQRGISFIENDRDVCLAFELANETFRRAGEHPTRPKDSWRLFQIVFLVTQIPGIVGLKTRDSLLATERERVDIVYFPTGGGKTEAYLGTLIFHCFFDRLRGKTAGVTAWTRFPLRLLTLQQTQRVADVIGMADLVRRENGDARLSGKGVAAFAVGYFVGTEATPNEIFDVAKYQYSKPENEVIWSQAQDQIERQKWKRVINCPACRTKTVIVDFDNQKARLFHKCTNAECSFPNGKIPIFVVDNEIYRYLPSVLVGTIDKLAGIGNQRKIAQIFGKVDGKCKVHGYYKGKCCQKDCDNKNLTKDVPAGISGPTLFIQDELHLLSEGLGTFDSHYETFVQTLLSDFGQKQPLKIIASSATVEAFERQVKHLYGRSARVFPSLGPTLGKSFYAETKDYPQRIFVGILPHNKTIFNSILELIEIYHTILQELEKLKPSSGNPYGGALKPGSEQWNELLDKYKTSLTYFLANRELDSILKDLTDDSNSRLEEQGLHAVEPLTMTGNVSTDVVTQNLEKLERTSDISESPNAVLATSMISHGVDVDRFNAMIFYGMPRRTAEYIQASSRVGRSHVGIVFDCFHPIRERDRSHYSYFSKYHEFLGQLIEPVAINRWAKFSIDRTLPGLFMGYLLQVLSNRDGVGRKGGSYYFRNHVVQLFNSGELREEDFIEFLNRCYQVDIDSDVATSYFKVKISEMVKKYKQQIRTATTQGVSDALSPRPMRSLRDVEDTLPIKLEY